MSHEFFHAVDPGRARSNNEDAVAVDPSQGLAVLADGMGGYNAGEVASGMATAIVCSELGRWLAEAGPNASAADLRQAVKACVDDANRAIFSAALANPLYAGMGTTLVVAVLRAHRLWLGHVGDSRAYRWRDGELLQLTRDHSLLQEQIDAGLISPALAASSPHRNLVTRALGVEPSVALEIRGLDAKPGDTYLLCSDGLTDMLADAAIGRMLQSHDALFETGQAMIDAANLAGGRDNISLILIRVKGGRARRRRWWRFWR